MRILMLDLDTLRPERFAAITRRGRLKDALAGIEAAHRAGLEPVKINSVIIRGLNDDEVIDLATYEDPQMPPAGIPFVVVNGRVAVDDGRVTGVLAGEAVP